MNNTANVSLTRMWIHDHSNYGIRGTEVDGFRLTDSLVGGVNGTNVASPFNDGSISFIGIPTTGYGLKGSVAFLDNEITGGAQRNVSIDNATGTMNLNFLRNNVHHTSATLAGDDGFALEADTSAVVFANISDNIFTAHGGDHFNLSLINNANVDLTFKNNDIQGGYSGFGIGTQSVFILGASYNGTFKYDISNNGTDADPFVGNKQGGAIVVNKGSGTATFSGQITNNVIGNPAVPLSGSEQAFGIRVEAHGSGGSHTALIANNKIREYFDQGMYIQAGEQGNPTGAALTATITNNTISDFGDAVNSLHGMFLDMRGVNAGDNNQVTLDIRNNLVADAGNEPAGGADIRLTVGQSLDVFLAGATTVTNAATADAYLTAQNPNATTITVTAAGSGTINNGPAIPLPPPNLPTLPPVALAPTSNQFFAQNPAEMNPPVSAQASSLNMNPANRFNTPLGDPAMFKLTSYTVVNAGLITHLPEGITTNAAGTSAAIGSTGPIKSPPLAPMASGETVNVTIGTLPAGKSVTIKFRVTVNGPQLPLDTTQISNQGTVLSNELPAQLTDDPSVGGASNPTITPVDRPDTSVVSLNRASGNPTRNASVTWQVVFNDPIINLGTGNFSLVQGSGVTGASLGGVTPVDIADPSLGSPYTTWNITANTGTGDGTLGLNLANDTGLSHDLTNLAFTGQVYTIDKTAPAVTNVTSSTANGSYNAPDVISL